MRGRDAVGPFSLGFVISWDTSGRPSAGTGSWDIAGAMGSAEAERLAEAAVLAEADLVVAAATKGELMVRALVSTSSPADAPQRRHYRA